MGVCRVAVIGAGAAGLVAAKELIEQGMSPVLFDERRELGGLWNFDPHAAEGGGPAYRSLRANTSARVMAFSDHPFPGDPAAFPGRAEVVSYLQSYAVRFGLTPHIRLGTRIECAVPTKTGGWQLTAQTGEARATEEFDALLVCTGRFREPTLPAIPGRESFTGRILHSRQYTDPAPFAGRTVLIIGAGSSAADIAADLGQAGCRVLLSTRSPVWFIPHHVGGAPYDFGLNRFGGLIPARLRLAYLRRLLQREYARLGLSRHAGLRRLVDGVRRLSELTIIPASRLLQQLAAGRVELRPGVERLTADSVRFCDGTHEQVDTVICCTGYRLDFPFLSGVAIHAGDVCVDLYKQIFPPGIANLGFLGLCRVTGPQFPVLEMQARWVARVLSGAAPLPSAECMQAAIDRLRPAQMQVELLPYLDELAQLLGVRPNPARGLSALAEFLFAPFTAAQYRSRGAANDGIPKAAAAQSASPSCISRRACSAASAFSPDVGRS